MASKPPNKKKANIKKPPSRGVPAAMAAAPKRGAKKTKPKAKIPTLGGNLMGLGGTGAGGMMP